MAPKKPDPIPEPEPGHELIPATAADAALLASIQAMEDIDPGDPDAIQMQIIERYLKATTPEEVLAPQSTIQAKNIIGQVFELHSAHYNRSTIEEEGSPPVYALIDAVLDGKRVAITCGSRNVMAQIIALTRMNFFPANVAIEELPTKTARGFKPLYLVAAPPDYVSPNGSDTEEPF